MAAVMVLFAAWVGPTGAYAQHRGMMVETATSSSNNPAMLQRVTELRSLGATCIRYPIYLGFQPNLDVWIAQIRHIQPYMARQNMGISAELTLSCDDCAPT